MKRLMKAFKPLLMMRTRGVSGPFFNHHHKVGTKSMPLSRSVGYAYGEGGVLEPLIWIAIPDQDVSQGGTWDIDLNDYVNGQNLTFSINTGSLPTGITLNGSLGTFSGTVTNIGGSGSVTFFATDSAGQAVSSGTLSWTIP